MKKIFALALAAVMAAGMTTTAFALKNAEVRFDYEKDNGSNFIMVDRDDNGKFDVVSTDHEDISYTVTGGQFAGFKREDGGKKVAIPVYGTDYQPLTDKDVLKGWHVKADWSVGDLDENPDFEYVKINDKYSWAVTFVLPESAELKTSDLAGSITIYENSTDKKSPLMGVNKLTFGVEYGYDSLNYDDPALEWADAEIVTFKGADDVEEMDFDEYFTFELTVTGQDKLNLKNNQEFDEEFANKYEYANINFITFEYEPRFNKIGTAYIYADEDAFIYEVTAEGAKEIKGLKWNEDYEAWEFKTRTLTSYAISDVELDEQTVTEVEDSSKTEGNIKDNPDTGR